MTGHSAGVDPVTRAGTGARAPRRILVAVLTYRRPDDLAAAIPLLVQQASLVTAAAGGSDRVEVLVVDNDPDAGARAAVARRAAEHPTIRYVHEPRPGIAAARNRALDEAADDDLLVFVDDDERPAQGWLQSLVTTFDASSNCGVVGPVVSQFAVAPDPWVEAGGFFRRRRLPTGSPVTVAATNNLLLDLQAVRRAGLRFDERLGLSGGSDTLFTRALVAAEGPLVWCDEAVVTDVVPPERVTRAWVLRRQLRSGNSWSRTTLMLTPGRGRRFTARIALATRGGARVVAGPLVWLVGALTGSVGRRARGAKATARGAGMILGAFGGAYVEYRRS